MNLSGRSIVVTGGGSGIGRAVAVQAAKAGARITVGDVNEAGGRETVAKIAESGGQGQYVKTDVSDEESVKTMIDAAVKTFGRLDGACNAAGKGPQHTALCDLTLQQWEKTFSVNMRGVFLCTKHQVKAMLTTGGGSIVNISSAAGVGGISTGSEYSASKAGVLGFVRAVAVEYAKLGIRCNAILPAGTLTPMLDESGATPELAAIHPMNRFAEAREVADGVLWLLSDQSSFVTGASIAVDGGLTASI